MSARIIYGAYGLARGAMVWIIVTSQPSRIVGGHRLMVGARRVRAHALFISLSIAALLVMGCISPHTESHVSVQSNGATTVTKTTLSSLATNSPTATTRAIGRPNMPMSNGLPIARHTYVPPVAVLVTSDDPELPLGCRPWQMAGLITQFFAAFNRGDTHRLAAFFPQEFETSDVYPAGEWYSVKGDRGVVAYDTPSLLRYLKQRHHARERLALIEVEVTRAWSKGHVGLSFLLIRRADDLRPLPENETPNYVGKADVDCGNQTFGVWSIAEIRKSEHTGMCPEPRGWKLQDGAIACSSR